MPNGVPRNAPDGRAGFDGLAASDEGYDLRVIADGYFFRTDVVRLTPDVELLLPNYHDPIDLRGRVTRRVTPDPQTGQAGG